MPPPFGGGPKMGPHGGVKKGSFLTPLRGVKNTKNYHFSRTSKNHKKSDFSSLTEKKCPTTTSRRQRSRAPRVGGALRARGPAARAGGEPEARGGKKWPKMAFFAGKTREINRRGVLGGFWGFLGFLRSADGSRRYGVKPLGLSRPAAGCSSSTSSSWELFLYF